MIKIGCCAFNFIGMGNEESLRLVRGMGFEYADIEAISSQAQINQLEAAAEPERVGAEVRDLAASLELVLAEFFVIDVEIDGEHVAPNHPDAALRARALEQFRRLCRCAEVTGCRSVMVVPGSPREGAEFEAEWDTSVATLRQMVPIARDHGLRLNVEPHSGSIATTPELAARLPREVEGLTYVLDYAHFLNQGFPQEEVYPLHEFATHMHAKPSSGDLVHEMSLDFRPIIEQLQARNWDGVISCECMARVAQAADLVHHPAIQNALMAHKLELLLAEVTSSDSDG